MFYDHQYDIYIYNTVRENYIYIHNTVRENYTVFTQNL